MDQDRKEKKLRNTERLRNDSFPRYDSYRVTEQAALFFEQRRLINSIYQWRSFCELKLLKKFTRISKATALVRP